MIWAKKHTLPRHGQVVPGQKPSEDASFGAHDIVPYVLYPHEVGSSCDFTVKKIQVKRVNPRVRHVDPFDTVIKHVINGLT
jgi:hypothetical protein